MALLQILVSEPHQQHHHLRSGHRCTCIPIPQLNTRPVTLTSYQDSVHFPSLTLFQRADWTSQANLDVSVPGKCFLGWYNESAPDCNDVDPGVTPCQCSGSWDDKVLDFQWHNANYRALTLTSNASMLSKVPSTQMIAQAFFNCKSYQKPSSYQTITANRHENR
jgi:hypothetical protein